MWLGAFRNRTEGSDERLKRIEASITGFRDRYWFQTQRLCLCTGLTLGSQGLGFLICKMGTMTH